MDVSYSRRDQLLKRYRRVFRPALLGTLRRTTPLSTRWGWDRGTPIDRYYIEAFLREHARDIRGDVLEVKDNRCTREFGSAVRNSHILDIDASNPHATIVADLSAADVIPSETFDCVILTQTLQYIYDVTAAIGHTRRILKDEGVLLATVPAVSRMAGTSGHLMDYWRFTVLSCSRLFGDAFGSASVEVRGVGNVLTSIAFLSGMAFEELRRKELDFCDEAFPLLVTIRAVRR